MEHHISGESVRPSDEYVWYLYVCVCISENRVSVHECEGQRSTSSSLTLYLTF